MKKRQAKESREDPGRIRELVEEVARMRRRARRLPLDSLEGFQYLTADSQAGFLHDVSWLRRWLKRISIVLSQKEGSGNVAG